MDIRFLGHACFELTDGDTRVLVDPFLSGNPKAAAEASELEPTHIFLTHGHADHYGDVIDIGKRTGAQVVANTELAGELGEQGLENVADPEHRRDRSSSTVAGCASPRRGTRPPRRTGPSTRRPAS